MNLGFLLRSEYDLNALIYPLANKQFYAQAPTVLFHIFGRSLRSLANLGLYFGQDNPPNSENFVIEYFLLISQGFSLIISLYLIFLFTMVFLIKLKSHPEVVDKDTLPPGRPILWCRKF